MNYNQLVQDCIERTLEVAPEYFNNMLRQRIIGDELSAGSGFFDHTPESLTNLLWNSDFGYTSGSVEEGTILLSVKLPGGYLGITEASNVPNPVAWSSPKNPNRIEAVTYVGAEKFTPWEDAVVVLGFKNHETGVCDVENGFFVTFFNGYDIGGEATIFGQHTHVKFRLNTLDI
jgi:hypothetical protein